MSRIDKGIVAKLCTEVNVYQPFFLVSEEQTYDGSMRFLLNHGQFLEGSAMNSVPITCGFPTGHSERSFKATNVIPK
jgi:hypothetical protein